MRRPRYEDHCGHEAAAFLGAVSRRRAWWWTMIGRVDRYDVYYVANGDRSSRDVVCVHGGNREWDRVRLCRDDLRDWPEVRMLLEELLA